MMSIFTRLFTLFSFAVLLVVTQIGMRAYEWKTASTSIDLNYQWPELLSLHVDESREKISAKSTIVSAYESQSYKLPSFETKLAKSSRSLPKIQFKTIDKSINIFEEAWGDVELDSEEKGQWREIRGDISIPQHIELEAEKIEGIQIEATQMVALFEGFKFEDNVMVAEVAPVEEKADRSVETKIIADEVTLLAAKSIDQDPEFFEYESDVMPVDATTKAPQIVAAEKKLEAFDYSAPKPSIAQIDEAKIAKENLRFFNLVETEMPEVAVKQSKKTAASPQIAMTTQAPRKDNKSQNGMLATHNAMTVVHGLSVSSQVTELRHFDLRAVDDGQTIIQDNGTGQIALKETLRSANNSRSFLLLNREHVVTHIDVPFAPGRADLSVPAFEKDFAEKYQVRNQKEPRGLVMVELDERTENITMDGAQFATEFLDEKFKKTKLENATYVLFYGVEVGNRTMSSTDSKGLISKRVIHVFEEELTFDPNLYLERKDIVVALKEEGIMSQKARDLAIAGDDVALTFSNIKSERLSTNTYKLRAPALLMGSRHYLTLSHQREEIFVGVDESKTVYVPSEELISAVIRKFKLQGHASACLIQVNLDRAAKKYDVMAESHQETHVSYAMVLDEDGGFYESLGEDSKKIFIMSESQSGDAFTQNSKINIKIDFLDGSTKTFSSFCSPNTYLVEQL